MATAFDFSSNDLKNFMKAGIKAPKTIVEKKTNVSVELISTSLDI